MKFVAHVATTDAAKENLIDEEWLESTDYSTRKDYQTFLEGEGWVVIGVYTEKQFKTW